MDAMTYNTQLDEQLSSSGSVDADLFGKLLEAHTYGAASTVGWLEAKLVVLQTRLAAGRELLLFEPLLGSSTTVSTSEAFDGWVARHFPAVSLPL